MKNLFTIYLCILYISTGSLFSQRENENWLYGNKKWTFSNNVPSGFNISANNFTSNTRTNAVISDKNTGELLFYTEGVNIYNKLAQTMENGGSLYGDLAPPLGYYLSLGNPSAQGTIILPFPGHDSEYYVFSLNGDASSSYVNNARLGMRYSIVDMAANAGLGKVTSKNNVVFSNTMTNAMTSAISSDGTYYWVVTQKNNGDYAAYKLSSTGLDITSPVISQGNGNMAQTGIKISPNGKRLFDIKNRYLYDFNNDTGVVSNPRNILFGIGELRDDIGIPCSADFSPNSNILYFITSTIYFGPNSTASYSAGLAYYNIPTQQVMAPFNYNTTVRGPVQLSDNGKIYISDAAPEGPFTISNSQYYYITNPNVWPTFNPIMTVSTPIGTISGSIFPQLIPRYVAPACPVNLTISQPVTANGDYQVSNKINASSAINNNLIVNLKANAIILTPGFQVSGQTSGIFRAYIQPCTPSLITDNTTGTIFSKKAADNTEINNLKIYPNPVSNILTIDNGKEKLISWQLYDVSGKLMKNGNSNIVDVQSIPNASYVLKINLEKTQISKTIMVKH